MTIAFRITAQTIQIQTTTTTTITTIVTATMIKLTKSEKVTITGITMTSTTTTSTENTIMINMCYTILVVFIVQIFLVMFIVDMSMPAKSTPVIPSSGNPSFEFKRYCSSALIDVIRVICDGQSNLLTHQYPNHENSTDQSNLRTLKRLIGDDSTFHKNMFTGLVHECCLRPCGYSELKNYCTSFKFDYFADDAFSEEYSRLY